MVASTAVAVPTTTAVPAVIATTSTRAGTFPCLNDSRDLPVLVGRPERDLEVFDELTARGSGRTRSQSRGMTISASCTNVLLAYAITVEAKRTVEEEAVENERAHDSLLDERLERERDRLENFERRDALLKQREEEYEPD